MSESAITSSSRWPALLGAAVVVALGAVGLSRFAASNEQCLIGTWRVQDSSSFPKAGTLELRQDGAASFTEFQDAPYSAVWKSTGDSLQVTLVSRLRPDLERSAEDDLNWRLQWKILEKTPNLVRLEGPLSGNWPSGHVSLVRQ
ncbi:hypothetical protein AYO47_02735 [Planctomyces sp. SCGC AG-212-M04]|nr:hypothetical protein AYO47_02735 [Planctomyces sp. SCGC AG-212-M04]